MLLFFIQKVQITWKGFGEKTYPRKYRYNDYRYLWRSLSNAYTVSIPEYTLSALITKKVLFKAQIRVLYVQNKFRLQKKATITDLDHICRKEAIASICSLVKLHLSASKMREM